MPFAPRVAHTSPPTSSPPRSQNFPTPRLAGPISSPIAATATDVKPVDVLKMSTMSTRTSQPSDSENVPSVLVIVEVRLLDVADHCSVHEVAPRVRV